MPTEACRKLARARVICPLAETEGTITFQFTAESRAGDKYEYTLETLLVLDKRTGAVTCDLPGLATLAKAELARCLDHRTGSDVTRVVQKLFDLQADLFAIREAGGCYFVPVVHAPLVDRVQTFLDRLNGRLERFPVPAGTAEGDRSVREAVACGLAAVIAEYGAAVSGFDADTKKETLERAAEKIRRTRLKVEGYAEYLADERGRLDRELTAAQADLRARVAALADNVAPAVVKCSSLSGLPTSLPVALSMILMTVPPALSADTTSRYGLLLYSNSSVAAPLVVLFVVRLLFFSFAAVPPPVFLANAWRPFRSAFSIFLGTAPITFRSAAGSLPSPNWLPGTR